MLAGKLAAEVVVDRSANMPYTNQEKAIRPEIIEKARQAAAKDPVGVKGEGAIAFGAGAVMSTQYREQLSVSDPELLVAMN